MITCVQTITSFCSLWQASDSGYKPRDLFNAGRDRAHSVASESPTKERCTMRQKSKSLALKVLCYPWQLSFMAYNPWQNYCTHYVCVTTFKEWRAWLSEYSLFPIQCCVNRGKKGNIVQGDTVKIERKGIFCAWWRIAV